jgi:hypothetical protein
VNVNVYDIAREYFPGLTDTQANNLLWEHTGYPEFWSIPEDGNTPEECLRKQLKELKERGPFEPRKPPTWPTAEPPDFGIFPEDCPAKP